MKREAPTPGDTDLKHDTVPQVQGRWTSQYLEDLQCCL